MGRRGGDPQREPPHPLHDSHMNDANIRRIESGDSFHSETRWIMAALIGAALVGFVLYFRPPLNFDMSSPEFNPMILLAVVMALGTIYNLFLALRGSRRKSKLGRSVFEMQGQSVSLGQTLEGAIRTSVPLAPRSDYALVFRCIESVRYTAATELTSKTKDVIRWEATARVDPRAVDSQAGIPVQFVIPSSLGSNTGGAGGLRGANVRWTLEIRAPLDGVDYYAIFGVPVSA